MRQLFAVLMVLALPLAAQEAQPVKQADSPLVAASKRANRKGKKAANVITNEMVRQAGTAAGAHVTTTTAQAPVPRLPEPVPTPDMQLTASRNEEKKKLAADGEAKKKAEAERARVAALRASAAEGELFEDAEIDPAQLEEAADQAAQQKPPRD